jgi:hypothetical protein
MDDELKRWTARHKGALVLEVIQGMTPVTETSRAHNPPLRDREMGEAGKRGIKTPCAPIPKTSRIGTRSS